MSWRNPFYVLLITMFLLLTESGCCHADSKSINLTEAEKAFIRTHPVIHLGIDPNFVPYEFIDTDGDYKGIAADYIQLISERTGLKMVVEPNLTWPDAYEQAKQGQLDVLPCVSKTEEREKTFLFSNSYYTFQRGIFIKKNNNDIHRVEELRNKMVAVQTNSSHHSYLKSFPNLQLRLYPSVEGALYAVANGAEAAFIGNLATTKYLMKKNGISNLKYIEMESDTANELHFAVRKDWPELVGIINKGLATITQEEKINIDNKWVGPDNSLVYKQILKIVGMIGAVILFALMVSSYWIIKLKKEIILRKKIEKELKCLKEEAETANVFKSIFLARMSHEIRTPLNAITGMVYLLTKTAISQTQKLYIEKISHAAKNMLGIINDILDFSKIEAGKIELEKIAFNLDIVLEQFVNIISHRIEEQGIDFKIDKSSDVPNYLVGDPLRLQQILINIVSNAVKFTKEGSVFVFISLASMVEDTCQIEFKVQDTGIGMTKQQLSQIFKPFDQGDASISRKFGGTGLGLTIAKNLIELMGGDIQVDSTENVGTTFVFRLNLAIDYVHENQENKFKAVNFKNLRVLVIEKSSFYINLLNEYLRLFEIVPEFAASGEQGLEVLKKAGQQEERPFDLLLLDYTTPAENGIEFFAEVRNQIKQLPKCILMIPIARENLFESLEAAAIDFGIIKPFMPSTLFNAILEINKDQILTIQQPHSSNNVIKSESTNNDFHILMVEDNKTNQLIAQTILDQAGYQITLADDGRAGYEFFAAHQENVDLILMDLHMPVLNGFESAALIRKINKNIPIIAMSADAVSGIEEKCKAAGINYYISKPFDPEQFLKTVKEVLEANSINKEDVQNQPDVSFGSQGEESANSSVIDTEDGIRRIGGSIAIYNSILEIYYKENKGILDLICDTVQKGDFDQAANIVHKVKGSSSNIGAKSLQKAAAEFQSVLKTGQRTEIERMLPIFLEQLKLVLLEIETRKVN